MLTLAIACTDGTTIIIDSWTYHEGEKGHGARDGCPGCPPEPATVEDIEAHWKDTGAPLTDEEFLKFSGVMEETIIEYETEQGDDEPEEF